MLKVTLRGIRAHKLRLLSTFLSIVLGVAFLTGTNTLTATVSKTFDDLFADVNRGTDAFVRSARVVENDFAEERGRIDDSLIDTVLGVDGVAAAEGFIQQDGVYIIGADGEPIGNTSGFGAPTFGGNWGEVDELNPFDLVEGSRAPETDDELVIDKKSADDGDLQVGDTVKVTAPGHDTAEYELVGIARFGTADSPGGATYALVTIDEAQRQFAEPGKVDAISAIAEEGVSQQELVQRIGAVAPDDVEILTGEAKTEEDQDAIAEGLSFFTIFLGVFVGIALIVGMFVIYNAFTIIVAQRLRENALLRAVGASRRQVVQAVLIEAVVVGVVGSLGGIAAGLGIAVLLKSVLGAIGFDLPATGLVVEPGALVTALLVGTVVTLLSALVPALRAARVPPVAAMRDVAIDKPFRVAPRLAITAALIGLGAWLLITGLSTGDGRIIPGILFAFIGIIVGTSLIARPVVAVLGAPLGAARGITGELARENARRSPRRTAATASALTIGITIIAFFVVFSASITASIDKAVDEQFFGDLIVMTPGFGGSGLPPTATEEIRSVDGVGAATSFRYGAVEVDGEVTFLAGLDADTAFELFDLGIAEGDPADLGPNEVGLSKDEADELEVGIGDTVALSFAETGEQPFTVVLIYEDELIAGPYAVDTTAFDEHLPSAGDAQIFIQVEDGADVAEVREEINAITDEFPQVELQDLTEFKEAQSAQFAPILGLVLVMATFAVIIAFFGVWNTMALSVLERTREIGLLRAVGGMRGQVRSMIRWESVLISVFGTLLGLAIGTGLAFAIATALEDEGFGAFEIPWPALIGVVLVTAVMGLLAALWPAYKASKLDVLLAISSE